MYDFAIGRQTAEHDVTLFELYHHMFVLPVDVPCFHGIEAPCFQMIPGIDIHFHHSIVTDAEKLFFLGIHELNYEQRDPIFRQQLPSFDIVHFGVDQM